MKKVLQIARNKYLIAGIGFIVWMLFFDRNDIPSQLEYRAQLNDLKVERDFYLEETATVREDLKELTSNLSRLQKFAREKYLMKKDNEDIFVIEEVSQSK